MIGSRTAIEARMGAASAPREMAPQRLARRLRAGADAGLAGILAFAVIFGPWAFGTTQRWSVAVMTWVGLAAWSLLLLKWMAGWGRRRERSGERRVTMVFGLLTAAVLLYCLVSAVNARATYHPERWAFEYHPSIAWLPHSYDRGRSWEMFWVYVGVAGIFWAARSWILSGAEVGGGTAGGRGNRPGREGGSPAGLELPVRLRGLLWLMSINGALLAGEALLQRLSGSNELLWLVEPRINKDALSQFGPYAYRANAAQYFNLLWPVALGLWWMHQKARRGRGLAPAADRGKQHHHLLLSCALLMAVCPIISTSRGGAIIMVASAALAGLVLLLAQWRSTWVAKLAVFGLLGSMVGGGVLLGWQELGPRFEMLHEGIEGRQALFITGWRMAAAEPVFGTGPGTFSRLYPLFRGSASHYWPAQLHNDWLETLITFGWVGTGLLVLGVLALLGRWFARGRIQGERHFAMLLWVALGGCLIHAGYDFPLQIHSILTLFVVLCAVLSCLSRRRESR